MEKVLVYNGSFKGFLSTVYEVFDKNIKTPRILRKDRFNPDMFTTGDLVEVDEYKASMVWNSLTKKLTGKEANEFYRCVLSEIKGVEQLLIRRIFELYLDGENSIENNYSSRISQVAKMVGREKKRLESDISFELTKDGIYQSVITPGFNLTPLLGKYFVKQYPFQKWVIYDRKRKRGIYYNLENLKGFTSDLAVFYKNELKENTFGNKRSYKKEINKGKLILAPKVGGRQRVV